MDNLLIVWLLVFSFFITLIIARHIEAVEQVAGLKALLSSRAKKQEEKSIMAKLVRIFKPIIPVGEQLAVVEQELRQAGYKNIKPEEFYAIRLMLLVSIPAIYTIFTKDMLYSIMGLGMGLAAYLAAMKYVQAKAKARNNTAEGELLDYARLLATVVDAGLSLEAGVKTVSHYSQDWLLSREFEEAFRQINAGTKKIDAISDIARRFSSEPVRNFIEAIIQAEVYGSVPISKVLRQQAELRRKHIETEGIEKAGKISVKMMPIVILLIFLPFMIIIFGPSLVLFSSAL